MKKIQDLTKYPALIYTTPYVDAIKEITAIAAKQKELELKNGPRVIVNKHLLNIINKGWFALY